MLIRRDKRLFGKIKISGRVLRYSVKKGETPVNHDMDSRHLEKIVPVRLSAAHWETLKIEAGRIGIGGSTLARMYIMESIGRLGKTADL